MDVASDGEEALWFAGTSPYDAVILDVMLPGMDGFEVCRKLRAAGCWAGVIMLSARGEVNDRVRGLDAGADDYLTKPFSFAELSARVRAQMRRGTNPRPVVLAAGDLRVDPVGHRAWRGDEELQLSPKRLSG